MIENRTYYVDNDKNKKINVIYDIDEDELDIITKRATKGEKYLNHKLLCILSNKVSYNEINILLGDFFIGMVVYFLFVFTFDTKSNLAIAFVTLFGFLVVILGVVFTIFFVTIYYSDRIIDCIEAVPILEDINALLSHVDEYKVGTTYNNTTYRLIFNDKEKRLLYFKTSNLTLHLNSDSQSNYYWEYSRE